MSKQNEPTPGEQRVAPLALAELGRFAGRTDVCLELLERTVRMLMRRVEIGRSKYGTYLMTHNGRHALRDAWEEAADLMFYLQQAQMEKPAIDLSVALDAARALVLSLSPAAPDGA